jgi:NAD(P)-dependent dehydrogenase (short-subunit alcohol dehydrogenase family)
MERKDLFRLDGRVAVVTGGVGIIGRECCDALAAFGASIVVVDIDEKACAEFAGQLTKKHGRPAWGFGCDLSRAEVVAEAVQRIEREAGDIHILFNNAASKSSNLSAFFEPVESFAPETWREVMSVNIDGMFWMAREVGAVMRRRNVRGSIIQTSSIYGVVGPDQRIYAGSRYMDHEINTPAVYSASKAAVVGLTRHLATYWGAHGIRVNALTPGGISSGQNDIFDKNYSARVPLGRMARVEEMVGGLIFLASDASSYVTGQNIIVDGGLTAW